MTKRSEAQKAADKRYREGTFKDNFIKIEIYKDDHEYLKHKAEIQDTSMKEVVKNLISQSK